MIHLLRSILSKYVGELGPPMSNNLVVSLFANVLMSMRIYLHFVNTEWYYLWFCNGWLNSYACGSPFWPSISIALPPKIHLKGRSIYVDLYFQKVLKIHTRHISKIIILINIQPSGNFIKNFSRCIVYWLPK